MKISLFRCLLISSGVFLVALVAPRFLMGAEESAIDIPKVSEAALSDLAWLDKAFHAEALTPAKNETGVHAALSLAWNEKGLLVHIASDDNTPIESPDDPSLWRGDSFEVYACPAADIADRFQFAFSPGRDGKGDPRFFLYDKRAQKPAQANPEMHVEAKSAKGYAMTALIPWGNFLTRPAAGGVIRLQVYSNDTIAPGKATRRMWYPVEGAEFDMTRTYEVRLATAASPPQKAVASISVNHAWKAEVRVEGAPDVAGKAVQVDLDGQKWDAGLLAAGGPDGSELLFDLPADIAGKTGGKLRITVAGVELTGLLVIPDAAEAREDILSRNEVRAAATVFDGNTFPAIRFTNSEMVDIVFGPTKLDVRYFDAGWNEVKTPDKPGRYGALVAIHAGGLEETRRITLYKTPKPYNPRIDSYGLHVDFPDSFGLPPDIAKREAGSVEDFAGRELVAPRSANPAVLIAGLHDIATDPAQNHGFSPDVLDDEWWTTLDRKLGRHVIYQTKVYLPEGYEKDPKKSWPLIICLHGSGGGKRDMTSATSGGLPKKMEDGAKLPFIIVAPLCPGNEWWCASSVVEVLDDVSAKYHVDAKRVYLTGLSMGGYGTWDTAARYPGRFAAVAPICGGANPELAPRLAKLPIWAFHGDADPNVPVAKDRRMIEALEKLHAPVKFTVYPGVKHDSWTQTYDNPALYEWFLQHSL